MVTPLLIGALALALLLLLDLRRRLDGLPARVWSIARQERDRDEKTAASALTEAAAARVISITAALRAHEEELATRARLALADAEKRARAAERHASDAGVALDAAMTLVRELRALLDEAHRAAARAPAEPDPDARATVEMPCRAAPPAPVPTEPRESEEPEELTTVAARRVAWAPAGSALPLSPGHDGGLPLRAFDPPLPLPSPPEPAQLAAGLSRPAASRPRSAAPPSGVAASGERRRATVIGLAPSDPRRAHASAPTLVSMAAVTPPSPRPAPRVVIAGEAADPRE